MQTSGASRREIAKSYLEFEQRHCDPLARNDGLAV
jgi:hypothetical protein